jgi:sec-independent protein translocase protein TatC
VTTQQINTIMPENKQPEEERAMTLIEHLVELRGRLVKASIGVLLGLGVGLFLVLGPVQLVDVIIRTFAPINPDYAPVQSIETFELFSSYMTVALTVGFILGMPVIVYQLLAFIVPGLTDRERRVLYLSLPFVTFFFIAGLTFGWFITVPTAIRFLVEFSTSELIQAQPTISDFLGKVTSLLMINGIVFELPVIIFVLAFLGVVTAAQLRKYRRFAVVVVVIVAALITPTGDPINLGLLAIPMYLLYEVGVFLARFAPKR